MSLSLLDYSRPHFADPDTHPFDTVEWEVRHILSQDKKETWDVECPKAWSDYACFLVATRYFRRGNIPDWSGVKKGNLPFGSRTEDTGSYTVPPITEGKEYSIRQSIHRLAYTLANRAAIFRHGWQRDNYYLDICYLILNQIIGPNTPAWINGGLYDVYGILGAERDRYWCDPETGEVQQTDYEQKHPGMAACYLTGIEDQLHGDGGMYKYVELESRIFAVGAGNGANISKIRAKGEPISGGGTAEGIISFLEIPDRSAAYIKSGGVTRRAARMLVLDCDHPDIEDFIVWKGDEQDKVVAMATYFLWDHIVNTLSGTEKEVGLKLWYAGLNKTCTTSFIDELVSQYGFKTVQSVDSSLKMKWVELVDYRGNLTLGIYGQTSNNSIMCTNAFMAAVATNNDWDLVWRTDPSKTITVKAKDLWNKICSQAWKTGDPGIMFYENINDRFTAPQYGPIVTSNPCAEVFMPDYCSCNLCTVNLVKVQELGWNILEDIAQIVILGLETIAQEGSSPSPEHAKATYNLRPLGANLGNLGALLMRQGLPYDSQKARELTNAIVSYFDAACWKASAEIARILGPYPAYNEENHYKAIEHWHRNAVEWSENLVPCNIPSGANIYAELLSTRPPIRNSAVTCMVPTGTIGSVLDYDTLGIEPDFSLVKHKYLAEGGTYVEIVNQSLTVALLNLGYPAKEVDNIVKKIRKTGTVVGHVLPEHEAIFDCSDACSAGRFIHVNGHIDMMQAIQDNISMSISKTVNMPQSATVEDISNAYFRGWEKGLKAVAIYRDKSKLSQPLLSAPIAKPTEVKSDEELKEILANIEEALK